MSCFLEYNGYYTQIHFSVKDQVLYGKIEGIVDLITFESQDAQKIEEEFHEAVDEYISFCDSVGKSPDKSYKGTFNVRITPELHRSIDLEANRRGITLNKFVSEAIQEKLDSKQNSIIIYYPIIEKKLKYNGNNSIYSDLNSGTFKTTEKVGVDQWEA